MDNKTNTGAVSAGAPDARAQRRNLFCFPIGTFGRDMIYNLFTNYILLYVLFTRFLLKQLLRVPIFPGLSACRDGTDSDQTVSLLAVSFKIACGHLLGFAERLQPGNFQKTRHR